MKSYPHFLGVAPPDLLCSRHMPMQLRILQHGSVGSPQLAILDPDIFTKIIYVVVFAIVLIMLVTKLLPLLKI